MKTSITRTVAFSLVVVTLLFGGVYSRVGGTSLMKQEPLDVYFWPDTYDSAGDLMTFQYALVNMNDYEIYDVKFTDNYGEVTCSSKRAWARSAAVCYRTYTTTDDDAINTSLNITVTVTGKYTESICAWSPEKKVKYTKSFTVTNTDPVMVRVAPPKQPAISLTFTSSLASFTAADQTVDYSYTLKNTGNIRLDGPFTIDDTLVKVSCPARDFLDVNETMACTASYKTTLADLQAGAIENTAFGHARYIDGTIINFISSNSPTVKIPLSPQPSLSLTKSADRTCYSALGETIHYNFTLTNSGNVIISGPFLITDNYMLAYALTCPQADSLAINQSLDCTGFYKVAAGDLGPGIFTSATGSGLYDGETITSNIAKVNLCYTAPTPTSVPVRVQGCSGHTDENSCNADPKCFWDVEMLDCKTRGD